MKKVNKIKFLKTPRIIHLINKFILKNKLILRVLITCFMILLKKNVYQFYRPGKTYLMVTKINLKILLIQNQIQSNRVTKKIQDVVVQSQIVYDCIVCVLKIRDFVHLTVDVKIV